MARYVMSLLTATDPWAPVMNGLGDQMEEVGFTRVEKDILERVGFARTGGRRRRISSFARTDLILFLGHDSSYGRLVPLIERSRANYALFAWDMWPGAIDRFRPVVARDRCVHCFVTIRSAVPGLQSAPRSNVSWLPEAVTVGEFAGGPPLLSRGTSVLEFGRRYEQWHAVVTPVLSDRSFRHLYSAGSAGRRSKLDHHHLFSGRREFVDGLRQAAISVCFPASMTHPTGRSLGTETLTARYLESMAASCLVVGHAPADLTALFGYNPVIEADLSAPATQLLDILANLGDYQGLVDKNLERVRALGSWSQRAKRIAEVLDEV